MSKSRTAREARDRKSPESTTAESLERSVLEFAEQLGWLVGTVKARSEGWLDREALGAQVGRIRDSAAQLLGQLNAEKPANAPAAIKNRGLVDAPGKRHRPAPPATHGIKHSDERVAKVVMSRQIRRRARG